MNTHTVLAKPVNHRFAGSLLAMKRALTRMVGISMTATGDGFTCTQCPAATHLNVLLAVARKTNSVVSMANKAKRAARQAASDHDV